MLQTTIIGNLGADAEVKELNGRKFVSFNVAHSERWTDENNVQYERTLWVSCTLNGDGGNLLPYLKKGTSIYAIGRTSTRVYSSKKERGFVAGLNLSVTHIELIGGKVDDIPSRLYTAQGREVKVNKAFFIYQEEGWNQTLLDKQGNQYYVQQDGWITRSNQERIPDEQQNENQED